MRQETITTSMLTPAQRRRIIGAIASAVRRTFRYPTPPQLPRYPDAIPDIDGHIDQLVRVVRESKPEARAVEIVKRSCPACPHQYPSRYCPLRPRGGCVLYRCAEPIAQAVAAALDDLDREASDVAEPRDTKYECEPGGVPYEVQRHGQTTIRAAAGTSP